MGEDQGFRVEVLYPAPLDEDLDHALKLDAHALGGKCVGGGCGMCCGEGHTCMRDLEYHFPSFEQARAFKQEASSHPKIASGEHRVTMREI